MAGMLLSGARPIDAAVYQFVLMAMVFAASGLTSMISTLMIREKYFSPAEQLICSRDDRARWLYRQLAVQAAGQGASGAAADPLALSLARLFDFFLRI